MDRRRAVAIGIALQTQVLKACPVHHHLYLDDEADPASAFALAIDLVRQCEPFVADFHRDEHALTDLLSDTLATTPLTCMSCRAAMRASQERPVAASAALSVFAS
jgi:hypothetical protein